MQHLSIYTRKITHKTGFTNIAHKYRANKLNIQTTDVKSNNPIKKGDMYTSNYMEKALVLKRIL